MSNNTSTSQINTITELLKGSGSQYRLYDVGRLTTKLSRKTFEQVELNQRPYPTPVQGHACFAIVFWQSQQQQPYLWILKLPLDERGLLNQGTRNHFIAIIIEALGKDLTQEASTEQEELLKSNPYLFTPAQYKMASLNSKIKADLKQDASEHLASFIDYLSHIDDNTKNMQTQWQHIGIQGITDLSARINDENYSKLITKALPLLPIEVLSPLCSALENEKYDIHLLTAILSLIENKLSKDINDNCVPLLMRAIAANSEHPQAKSAVEEYLALPKLSTNILVTLSSRCWLALSVENTLICYFEHLLNDQTPELFTNIFKDLVTIPALRPTVLQCIRSENRSPALAQAIGKLFS